MPDRDPADDAAEIVAELRGRIAGDPDYEGEHGARWLASRLRGRAMHLRSEGRDEVAGLLEEEAATVAARVD